MELENDASRTVFHFISEMNEWEKFCNIVAQDKSLAYDEQYALQKERLLHIFNLYCRKAKEKVEGQIQSLMALREPMSMTLMRKLSQQ